MTKIVAVVTLLVLASSLALARKNRDAKAFTQLAAAPEAARARVNPLAGDSEAVAAGRKLYERHCADCHGISGENGRKGPGLLAPELQSAPDGAVFWAITNGNVRGGMPVWSRLPEPQRWQLTTYLKSLGLATAPPAPGRARAR
jgi:mono/diheme cytochrome c family protein